MEDYNNNSESYGQIKIDDRVKHLYTDSHSDNVIENRLYDKLNEEFYEIFLKSPYLEKYKTPKRVDASNRIEMYYYFKEHLNNKSYTDKDIFIAFAEFFQVNYEQLYNEIAVLDKENIIKELNENEQYKNRINSKKLF